MIAAWTSAEYGKEIMRGIAFLAILGISACELPTTADPVAAYLSFQKAAQGRNAQSAFAALSSATKEVTRHRSKAISTASGGVIKDDPIPMVMTSPLRRSETAKPRVSKTEKDTAWVLIDENGRLSEVKLVLEQGKWKIDLTRWLVDES